AGGTAPVPAPATRGKDVRGTPSASRASAVAPARGPLTTSHPGGPLPGGSGRRDTAQPAGTAITRSSSAVPAGAGVVRTTRITGSPGPVPATPSQATVAPLGRVAPTSSAWSPPSPIAPVASSIGEIRTGGMP